MKRYFTPILLWYALGLSAQQFPQYSLYMLNPYSYNPAYAGLDNTLVANGMYRQQWSNLEGAPATVHFNAHLPLFVISSGVGLKVENDIIGAHRVTLALLSYNYQLELGRSALLSAGFSAGYMQYSLDGNKLRAPDGVYEPAGFNHNDQFLPEGKVNAGTPLLEAGIFLQIKKFQVGASMQPAFAPVLSVSGDDALKIEPVQHYFFTAAYAFDVGEHLSIRPSAVAKTDFVETQVEISSVLQWNENIFAGASFRGFGESDRDAAVILAGLRLNDKTSLGYSYDIPLSPLNSANRGSHELLLRYSLNKPIGAGKLPPIIYNPRFL
ncbi:MAG: type IX secretion system membrane protein PorP/SprF [Haliscomenobacteraceae bacterium CHB4]|nr:type IX secretion system membrane protein PorP/SprF [Haliscomenobacteraceae bacterium CHB4]